jgi:hypothetical protein
MPSNFETLLAKAQGEQEIMLALVHRELNFLYLQIQRIDDNSLLCKLLHLAEQEAYAMAQERIEKNTEDISQNGIE